MTETPYTEEKAIREAMERLGDAVVITGGYDMEIIDYLNTMEDEGPEVYVEQGETNHGDITVPALVVRKVVDGYIDTGEALARIVSFEDYEKLGRE